MKKLFFTIYFAFFGTFLLAQEKPSIIIESVSGPKPYTNLDVNNAPENFQFAIVSDRTGGLRPGVFLKGIRKLNLLQPEFVMSVGDLIEGYTEDVAELDRQWTEFNGFIEELEMPFFYTPGNHDITNKVMETKWKELFGKTYYHFIYKDVLFLCLNSEDNYRGSGRGTIDAEQYEYIKNVLKENEEVKWTLLFMHQPLWDQEANTRHWKDVEILLKNRKHTVYAGHRHRYVQYERNNSKYYILATTGGGSRLRGPQLGEFDHVVWITMTEDGPIMANLLLDGIWDEEVHTEGQKEFLGPLLSAKVIDVAPMLMRSELFEEESTSIKISNDSDVPMEVSLELLPSAGLTSNIITGVYAIEPNSVKIIKTEIASKENIGFDDIEPFELRADINYLPKDKPKVNLNVVKKFKPEPFFKLNEASFEINVDGKIDEWENLSNKVSDKYVQANPFSHQGDKDGSFVFDVVYDENYLYVAAQVTDDEIIVSEERSPIQKDGLSLILDARPLEEAVRGNGSGNYTDYFIISPPVKIDEANRSLYEAEKLPEGTLAATTRTENGFITEIAIPLQLLKEKQGDNWQNVRINLAQIDIDNTGSHQSYIFWRPDWRGEDNLVGSGTFMKE